MESKNKSSADELIQREGSENDSYYSANESYSDEDDENSSSLLSLALEKMLNITDAKKKLLVLDLNGFLIHRAHRLNLSEIPKNRQPDGIYDGNFFVYKRPFLAKFMEFCLDRFEVGLWSSAMEKNVDGVLVCADLKRLKNKFFFIWDQSKCDDYGYKSLKKSTKPLFFKPIEKVWKINNSRVRFSKSNTLLIDDDPCKALLNPFYTAVFPDPYDAAYDADDVLDPKGELAVYLEGLAEAEDVPSYVKDHPFGQPAIGPNHPDWYFYSKIISRVNA